jgi:predicted GNAT family acetyltransferase
MDFKNFGPNQAMIDSTLNGTTPGEVFDDLIVTNFGFSFGSLEHARAYSCERKRTLSLITTELLEIPERCIKRRDYLDVQPISPNVETPYTIGPFDPEKSNWQDVVKGIWGSFENYREHGCGIGIFDGPLQVSEAMVGFLGNMHWEIGTVTHKDYRGKGLSSLASFHLIKKLVDDGIAPSWSCNEDNSASNRLAEKIGFKNYQPYYFYVIEPR